MAKTAKMKLAELMVLKQDIDSVLAFLGKEAIFQFQEGSLSSKDVSFEDGELYPYREMFEKLQIVRSWLGLADLEKLSDDAVLPSSEDAESALSLFTIASDFHTQFLQAEENKKRLETTYAEALAFSHLKVNYTELEHLSFLSIRVGKIDPALYEDLVFSVGQRGVIVSLGEDNSRIMVAATNKTRGSIDGILKRFGFVELEVPETFKGIPDEMLESLEKELTLEENKLNNLKEEQENFITTHKDTLYRLLNNFSLGMQVESLKQSLECTQLVYRLTGWVLESESQKLCSDLDDLTSGRIAIRFFKPDEVPSIKNGYEKVPVALQHGKFVKSFQRMVFSYGSPLYGTIDPTPLVAFFFTLLFGIMFGDAGQGLVFILLGILLTAKKFKFLSNWHKFGPIFIGIGCSSFIMGLLTGEFFANSEILVPFTRYVTSLFGEPHDHILHLMPSANSIDKLFYFFLFTIAIGFIINSVGLIINIINQFSLKNPGKALFGKIGLSGALFFWYIVFLVIRIVVFKSSFYVWDGVILGIALFGVFFAHPLERLVNGERPIFLHGLGTAIIEGLVEILEIISSYLSNSVSFLRVGAFALAHAVLGFIIFTMTELIGGPVSAGGLLVTIVGNVIVIVLEGMIVAIQVIRLQYYEFFSKFFLETGEEFKPFTFVYNEKNK
ncbi:MAG: ATPase [Spirochaetaceae bacterium]|nr:ATPase [Spirochaetaceae bacterium]